MVCCSSLSTLGTIAVSCPTVVSDSQRRRLGEWLTCLNEPIPFQGWSSTCRILSTKQSSDWPGGFAKAYHHRGLFHVTSCPFGREQLAVARVQKKPRLRHAHGADIALQRQDTN
ncbi:hypothetical protein N657DRAFT_99785 [Parathielavia appendiculata]|uniref:Uncharacterized protein n=1 Tax=Parathielavia appendiculata TaxID=2587402 RepID=A0AAN6TW61_9PEZI|nr:hypothetical protein N657DRAFT_99785 [Parathielavia appendiculata]